ncbi:MAG: hypothetical protein R2865_02010 [Deinococcales bacterium]
MAYLPAPSSGAHLVAAKRLKKVYPELKNIVTILCDKGEKYLSEHFQSISQIRYEPAKASQVA